MNYDKLDSRHMKRLLCEGIMIKLTKPNSRHMKDYYMKESWLN